MTDNLGSLVSVLNKLLGSYVRLRDLSQQQRRALIDGNMELLNAVIQKMTDEVASISELEISRHAILDKLTVTHHIPREQMSFSSLEQAFVSDAKLQELTCVADSLNDILSELSRLNNQNSNLTQQSLKYIAKSFELLSKLAKAPTYGRMQNRSVHVGAQFISVRT